ncbi:MAG TPA: DUF262 domain-containing protein [Candidatus Paceibacterota bacterium]|nr:DUF262 domain-containing protein [Candidatus Paceibacterota bacterium]
MSFYIDQHLSLNDIIQRASDDRGATILIPDLQRPYVWVPNQVVLLVDSLIRGWPFGTLLLWKVHHSDLSNIPSRAFWRVVDRTDEDRGQTVSQKNPPAEFHMVLDGQQRLQSLLLAFGGDSWGFKMYDRSWREELEGKKPKGTPGTLHWSMGNLCLDLSAFTKAYQNANNHLLEIDYTQVLTWVVNDDAGGKSASPRQSGYTEPLKTASASECKGQFIRLSRLWQTAQPNPNLKEAQFRKLVEPVLDQHQVSVELKKDILPPLGELLATFSGLRSSMVNFLELQPFNEMITSRDDYNDSIVNIFTRLNTAGRTLTREEITFAWLKTGWDISATSGKTAIQCVEELAAGLKEIGIELSNDEIVGSLSFLWSVCFNKGALLSNRDLLRGETIRPMASQLSQNWGTISKSLLTISEQIHDRGLEYKTHYLSLNAVVVFWTWRYLLDEWVGQRPLTAPLKDAAQKRGDELLKEFCDRWLLCSQWADTWGSSGGKTILGFASQLATDRTGFQTANRAEAVVEVLRERMQTWLKGFELAASNTIRTLGVAKREQVREYYAALWLWHRLENTRWAASQIPLRDNKRTKSRLDVDHIAPVKLLEERFKAATPEELQALGGEDALPTLLNSVGNCFVMEKTFNISKGKKPLAEFLAQVHEFCTGARQQDEWGKTLAISEAHRLPDVADLSELATQIKARETVVKDDLVNFVNGSATRVDLK